MNGLMLHAGGYSASLADITNVVKSQPQKIVNFRVGVETKNSLLEAFVLNAFHNYYFSTVQRDTDQFRGTVSQGAIYVGPPVRRQAGIRARYSF